MRVKGRPLYEDLLYDVFRRLYDVSGYFEDLFGPDAWEDIDGEAWSQDLYDAIHSVVERGLARRRNRRLELTVSGVSVADEALRDAMGMGLGGEVERIRRVLMGV